MNNTKINNNAKRNFRKLYHEDFDDPCEDFVDALYDIIPENIIENELKKIKGMKIRHGKFYLKEDLKKKKNEKNY